MLNAGMTYNWKYKILRAIGLGPKTESNGWLNNTKAVQLRNFLKRNQFDVIEKQLKYYWKNDPDLYSLLVSALKQWPGNSKFIKKYVDHYPDSEHSHIISGANKIHWAWEARSSYTADEVSDKQWELFFERLEEAENHFNEAITINSSCAEPYSYLINIAMGNGQEKDDLYSVFASLKLRNANHVIGHMNLLYALTEKWCRSHDEMFSFAHNTYKKTQPGNPLAVVIPQAHIEMWSYIDIFEEDQHGAYAYMSRKDVQDEILDAYHHSINNDLYQTGVLTPLYRGLFAMAFYLTGNKALARVNCSRLSQGFAEYPWHYLNETQFEDLNAGYVLARVKKELQ